MFNVNNKTFWVWINSIIPCKCLCFVVWLFISLIEDIASLIVLANKYIDTGLGGTCLIPFDSTASCSLILHEILLELRH
jgi:hypothetical protein